MLLEHFCCARHSAHSYIISFNPYNNLTKYKSSNKPPISLTHWEGTQDPRPRFITTKNTKLNQPRKWVHGAESRGKSTSFPEAHEMC
jgi:hypothetical protein